MEREVPPAIEKHFPLVWSLVNRLGVRGPEREDLFGAGCLGLVKAWKRFDPNAGTAFSTYAVPVILGEMQRFLREGRGIRVPRSARDLVVRARRARARLAQERGEEPSVGEVAAAVGVHPADLVAAEEACLPPRSLEDGGRPVFAPGQPGAEDSLDLALALARLEPRERAIIQGRYFEELTQQEVAARLGISQSQVSRLEQKALARLRGLLAWHSTACERDKLVAAKEGDNHAGGEGAGTGGEFPQQLSGSRPERGDGSRPDGREHNGRRGGQLDR